MNGDNYKMDAMIFRVKPEKRACNIRIWPIFSADGGKLILVIWEVVLLDVSSKQLFSISSATVVCDFVFI